jgi:hypothetical protein
MIFAADELLSGAVVEEDGGLFKVDLFGQRIKRDEIPVEMFVSGTHFTTSFPASAAEVFYRFLDRDFHRVFHPLGKNALTPRGDEFLRNRSRAYVRVV